MSEQYTYAVARIRALEVGLFSNSTIDQLIACQDYGQCLQFLEEKGWGDSESSGDAEAILTREEEKIWEVVKDLHIDTYMQHAAAEAYESLLHTGDGQLCDCIIDRAALDAIYEAGKESDAAIIRDYAESTVGVADIKIAVRSQKTAKSMDFMKRAMAECESVNVDQLSKAALAGMDAIRDYLLGTAYAEGADALAESPSAFERWCDNRIIQTISPQKYQAFTIGPVIAYVIARQNEIKTVRIILSGKQNELPEDSIRERVREMYV